MFWLLEPLYKVTLRQLTNNVQLLLETLRYHRGVEMLVALNLLGCCVEVLVAHRVHTILKRTKVSYWADLEHWLLERKLLCDAALYRFLWLEYGSLHLLFRLDIGDVLGW